MWKGRAPFTMTENQVCKLAGHTSTAFAVATVFAKMYADKPVIPILAYTTASMVGLSRLTEHTHWASDIFVGAALGYLCGNQVMDYTNNNLMLGLNCKF